VISGLYKILVDHDSSLVVTNGENQTRVLYTAGNNDRHVGFLYVPIRLLCKTRGGQPGQRGPGGTKKIGRIFFHPEKKKSKKNSRHSASPRQVSQLGGHGRNPP